MSKSFDETEVDSPATAEEQAQAEALAHALEGRGAGPAPELETAALLRQARVAETPDVRAQVLPALAARRPRRRWFWLAAGLAVPATVVILIVGGVSMRMERVAYKAVPASAPAIGVRRVAEAPVPARPGPPPTAALLQAQAKAARGDRRALAALESEMHSYRSDFYRLVGAAILVTGDARVDELLNGEDAEGALRTLRELWASLRQSGAEGSLGGRQAAQDIAFRLARLSLGQKDLSGALAFCEGGLSLGKSDDLFTANLLILRGIIRQELGQSAAAAEDFHQALLINEKLLEQVLKP